ncbi:MAG TPA: hypothetical protein DCE48_03735 [Lachnospiraceae bacterium]|uniref:GNAT family N-acetyltransferase n=1 Tax=Anaerosporobacter sp. TaxID=1872529 RepID=UPI000EC9EE42|nr:GNAT family N-acetyltransferase [Anaerosporobacter sp.]HAB59813.1 hypothetical protein [Lachnospiraceae bacterium]
MNFNLKKVSMKEAMPVYEKYVQTFSGVVDDFWEEHILKGDIYLISDEGEDTVCGCFSTRLLWNDDTYLTSFYVEEMYYPYARDLVERILKEHNLTRAFVATCDEAFLSICIDLHKKIELQAYFFDGTIPHKVREPEFTRDCIKQIGVHENECIQKMRETTGDFFDSFTLEDFTEGRYALYQLESEGEVLGYGVIVPNQIQKGYLACGMITIEEKRRKGVGRSLQYHLGNICREQGGIPISGCWYYNHLSKKTITSAGRYSKTRLLNISF